MDKDMQGLDDSQIKELFSRTLRNYRDLVGTSKDASTKLNLNLGTFNNWVSPKNAKKWAGVETSKTMYPKVKKLIHKLLLERNKQLSDENSEQTQLPEPSSNTKSLEADIPIKGAEIHYNIPAVIEEKTFDELKKIFEEKIEPLDEHSNAALNEYFSFVKDAMPDSWFEWCRRGIEITSRKQRIEQKGIGYLLGIYKTWLRYGFGTFVSEQQKEVMDIFKDKFGCDMSPESIRIMNEIIHNYGIVRAVKALYHIGEISDVDISLILINKALNHCKDNDKTILMKQPS